MSDERTLSEEKRNGSLIPLDLNRCKTNFKRILHDSLRLKTLGAIAISCLLMTCLLFISSQMIVMEGFSKLEENAMQQNIERAENAIAGEIRKLDAIAYTWASAEETNTFLETRDHVYFQSAFPDEKFTGSNINIILFVDHENEIINHKYINLDYGHVMPTPRSLLSQLAENDITAENGILVLGSGPMLIATRPIIRSGQEEPSGTIIVGRYLDQAEMGVLSRQTELQLSVYESYQQNNPDDIQQIRPLLLSERSEIVNPIDENTVAGYTILSDLHGNPGLIMKVEMPRDIFQNGQSAIQFSLLALVILGIISGAVTMGIMERMVLDPLSRLKTGIRSIRDGQSVSSRIDFTGDDEIAQVASGVNRMLDSLERSQNLLKQSEERFRHLFNDAHDIFFTTDTNGMITSTNRMAETLTGYTKTELIERELSEFFPDISDQTPNGAEPIQTNAMNNQSFETRITTKTGKELILDLHIQQRYSEGRICGLFGIARDITEKRAAEEELARYQNHLEDLVRERTTELSLINVNLTSEIERRRAAEQAGAAERERLSVTLSSITDGVIATDTRSRISLINKPAADLIGRSKDDLTGMDIGLVLPMQGGDGDALSADKLASEAIAKNAPIMISRDLYLEKADSLICPIEFSAAPIRDCKGAAIGSVCVIRDIGERRRHEDEMIRIEKLESIGLLAGGIAHDFNNILTAITGNLMIARMEITDNPAAIDRIERAETAALRARDMTRQLVTFAKGGSPVKETADIRDLIKETTLFVLQGTASRAEILIEPDLWTADVDCGQIGQVISNLVINANQAMPDGGIITVNAKNCTIKEDMGTCIPGDYLCISVHDQGCGISQNDLTRIFDPYFTTKQNGNGLGLASCLSIIKKHGGTIDVVSKPDIGTTFSIYLPASKKALSCRTCELTIPCGRDQSILIMDDDEAILEIASVILTQQGYTVTTATDGDEAICLYREAKKNGKSFDAVIMDLTIPGGMGGREAMAILYREDPSIKAIVSSGYSEDPVMSAYREHGYCAVLPKPYRGRDLLSLLDTVLNPLQDENSALADSFAQGSFFT